VYGALVNKTLYKIIDLLVINKWFQTF